MCVCACVCEHFNVFLILSWQVNCVAFSSDFQIMVTGSDDQRVRVFNAKDGTLVCKLKGHTGDHWQMSQSITKPAKWPMYPARLKSTWASALFCQPLLSIWRFVFYNLPIRCPGWSESSLVAHIISLVLSCSGSNDVILIVCWGRKKTTTHVL